MLTLQALRQGRVIPDLARTAGGPPRARASMSLGHCARANVRHSPNNQNQLTEMGSVPAAVSTADGHSMPAERVHCANQPDPRRPRPGPRANAPDAGLTASLLAERQELVAAWKRS
jgi:hypothetical protein